MDMRQAEIHRISEISRRKDNVPVRVTTSMHDLIDRASTQNFVPVVDDKDAFIGIVTRRSIISTASRPSSRRTEKQRAPCGNAPQGVLFA